MWFTTLLGANMQNADLRGANLGRTLWEFANLSGVNAESTLFSLSDFTEANFTEGCFSGADFTGCHFVRVEAAKANFRFATLAQAVLRDSGFTLTDFGGADFTLAYLHRLRLQEAVLNDTLLLNTAFLECEDLHQAVGLEEVSVNSKVLLELKTLRANGAKLPEAFLLSAGISATEAKAFYS